MTRIARLVLGAGVVAAVALGMAQASAYTLECPASDACKVWADCAGNRTFIGTMYWNGSRWSDGIRSNENQDALAKEMVAAFGSACK